MGQTIVSKNKFYKGVNQDTNENDLISTSLVKSENTTVTENGSEGAIVNIKGTTELSELPFAYSNILNSTDVKIKYDYDCDGEYEVEHDSIVYFVYGEGGSKIFFFDTVENKFSEVGIRGDLKFPPKGTIETIQYFQNNYNWLEFTDGENSPKKLRLTWSCEEVQTPQDMLLFPLNPNGEIKIERTERRGAVSAGSYAFFYRLYNTKSCRYSAYSHPTNPYPVVDYDCGIDDANEISGDMPGRNINKSILISFNNLSSFNTNYNAIQLGVIKYTDGSLEIPQTVYLLEPDEDAFQTGVFRYTGNHSEFEIPSENILVSYAPVKTYGTQVIKQNRKIVGDIKYHPLNNDNGSVEIDAAKTIEKLIPKETSYKCERNTHENTGHFRNEMYAYYRVYHDEFGNWGNPEPIDLSNFYKGKKVDSLGNGTATESNTTETKIVLDSPTGLLTEGDYVSFDNDEIAYLVTRVDSQFVFWIQGQITGQHEVFKNVGSTGNNANNWAWKYPSRDNKDFTILNENNDVSILGLRIEGLKNHPSWAKGILILRQKRKKNIIGQSIHIPTVLVQGVKTTLIDEDEDSFDKDLDYIGLKNHSLGAARNIRRIDNLDIGGGPIPDLIEEIFESKPFYQTQGPNRFTEQFPNDYMQFNGGATPRLMLGVFPFYMYNNRGEPFNSYEFKGTERISVVDAVAMYRLNKKDEENDRVNVYSAISSENYFYDRSGSKMISGVNKFGFKLQDFQGVPESINILKNYNLTLNHPAITISSGLIDGDNVSHVDRYGAGQELTEQQGAHPSVITDGFFNLFSNQRGMLLELDESLYDFTMLLKEYWTENQYLFQGIQFSRKPNSSLWEIGELYDGDRVTENYASDEFSVGSCAYIINLELGLSDDRYSKYDKTAELISTGAYRQLSSFDVSNNTPLNIDIWGGDCFISKQVLKVNQNNAVIKGYDPFDPAIENGSSTYNEKVGTYKKNIEVIEYFVESEVNTGFQGQKRIYPEIEEDSGFTKEWLYPYHPNYSQQADSKLWFVEPKIKCNENNGQYPRRRAWTDLMLEEAGVSSFIDTFGFDKFRVLNVDDSLLSKHGRLTALVDLGGDRAIHCIQENKVYYQPIGVDVVKTGDGQNLTLTTGADKLFGNGGVYLPYDVGSQHKRTIKVHNGLCFMADNYGRKVVSFGNRGANYTVISSNGLKKFFNEKFSGGKIDETLLHASINKEQGNEQYMISHVGEYNWVWNIQGQLWDFNLVGKTQLTNAISTNKKLFFVSDKIYSAYSGERNNILGALMPSKFAIVVNERSDIDKVLNAISGNGESFGVLDTDEIIAKVNNDYGYENNQYSKETVSSSIRNRNHRFFANRIKDDKSLSPIRGQDFYIEFVINPVEKQERFVRIYSILTNMKQSFRNL